MLRCTLTGLITLLQSRQYRCHGSRFFSTYQREFQRIIEHESYYLIRELPEEIAQALMLPILPGLLQKQRRNGAWKQKDSERITYDILRAMKRAGIFETLTTEQRFPYDPALWTYGNEGIYALLAKLHVFRTAGDAEAKCIDQVVSKITEQQQENGSWEDNLVSTCHYMKRLLDLNAPPESASVQRGVSYVFSKYKQSLEGWHITSPYGLVVSGSFSDDRQVEFEAALRLKPEWTPRSVCFRHIAIQQNAECVRLLLGLGYEEDPRVTAALNEMYRLLETYHGLCDSDVKKAFVAARDKENGKEK